MIIYDMNNNYQVERQDRLETQRASAEKLRLERKEQEKERW